MSLASSRRLPDWPDEGTDSSLRDAEEEYPTAPITSIASRTVGFGSSPKFASPASRTPVGGPSPQGSFNINRDGDSNTAKSTWKDLDKFYEDGEEEEDEDESEEGDDDVTEAKIHEEKEDGGEDSDEDDDDDDDDSASGSE